MTLSTITTKSGKSIQAATRITPPPPGWLVKSPGMVLLHDWFGHDKAILGHTERLTDILRTLTVSPEYLKGKTAEDPFEAWLRGKTLEQPSQCVENGAGLDWDHAIETVRTSVEWIKAQEATTPTKPGETMDYPRYSGKIALVGFGLGGAVALAAASKLADPDICAVVSFYGVPKAERFTPGGFKGTAQVHLAKNDESATQADFDAIQKIAKGSIEASVWPFNCEEGKDDERYPAKRGFLEHQPMVAVRVWRKVLPFLRESLNVGPDGTPLDEYNARAERSAKMYAAYGYGAPAQQPAPAK